MLRAQRNLDEAAKAAVGRGEPTAGVDQHLVGVAVVLEPAERINRDEFVQYFERYGGDWAKLVPPPSYVAPRGDGSPGHTSVLVIGPAFGVAVTGRRRARRGPLTLRGVGRRQRDRNLALHCAHRQRRPPVGQRRQLRRQLPRVALPGDGPVDRGGPVRAEPRPQREGQGHRRAPVYEGRRAGVLGPRGPGADRRDAEGRAEGLHPVGLAAPRLRRIRRPDRRST